MPDIDTPATAPAAGPAAADADGAQLPIIVYWRPGCPFCSMLRRGLDRAGVTYTEIDIWDDPAAAAFVRSVANGNETVPTVTVGQKSLVNPPASLVAAMARGLIDDGARPEQA